MKTVLCVLMLGLLAFAASPDTSVAGTWSGTIKITRPDGETRESPAYLMLKQSGTDISGSVGPDQNEQHPIKTGKLEGAKLTLFVDDEGTTVKFDLALADDHLTGNLDISHDGEQRKGQLDVKRVK